VSGLLAAELRGFWSRRLLWVLVVLMLLMLAWGAGQAFWNERFRLSELADVFLGTSLILTLVGWVLGASAIGAEWHAGTVTTLLTWEPRRIRVMVAKIAVALGSVFLLSLAMQGLLGGALTLVAASRGSTVGADGAWLAEVVGVALRCAALGTFGAAVGFAFASVGRNTAGALGVAFGYFVVVENLVHAIWPKWHTWLVSENAANFLLTGSSEEGFTGRSGLGAGFYLLLVACALLAVAAAIYRARDVT
jgi:ABC-type transport system involved in multi-copper enzyme maturation permease subunit